MARFTFKMKAPLKLLALGFAGAALVVGFFVAGSFARYKPPLDVKLKRYGKTREGAPVAWLVISNRSAVDLRLLGDLNPVPTAFCEYTQQTSEGQRIWEYRPTSLSGPIPLKPTNSQSMMVYLPTNGFPAKVNLWAIEVPARTPKHALFETTKRWLYRKGFLSSVKTVPVPFELQATNVLSKFR